MSQPFSIDSSVCNHDSFYSFVLHLLIVVAFIIIT